MNSAAGCNNASHPASPEAKKDPPAFKCKSWNCNVMSRRTFLFLYCLLASLYRRAASDDHDNKMGFGVEQEDYLSDELLLSNKHHHHRRQPQRTLKQKSSKIIFPDERHRMLLLPFAGDVRFLKSRDFTILEDLLVDTYNDFARRDPQRRVLEDIQVAVYNSGDDTNFTQFVLLFTMQGTCLNCYEADGNTTLLLTSQPPPLNHINVTTATSNTTSNNTTTTKKRKPKETKPLAITRPPTRVEWLQAYSKEIARAVASGRLTTGGVLSVLDLQPVKEMSCRSTEPNSYWGVFGYMAISFQTAATAAQNVSQNFVMSLETAVQNAYNTWTTNNCDTAQRSLDYVALRGGSNLVQTRKNRFLQTTTAASALDFNLFVFELVWSVALSCDENVNDCSTVDTSLFSPPSNDASLQRQRGLGEERGLAPTLFGSFGKDFYTEPFRRYDNSTTNATSICTCPVDAHARAPTMAEFQVSLSNEIAKLMMLHPNDTADLLQITAVGNVTQLNQYCDGTQSEVEESTIISLSFSRNNSNTTTPTPGQIVLTDLEKKALDKAILRSYNNMNFQACDYPYFRRLLSVNCQPQELNPIPGTGLRRLFCIARIKGAGEMEPGEICTKCTPKRRISLFGNYGNRKQRSRQYHVRRDLQENVLLTYPTCYCPTSASPSGGITGADLLSAVQDAITSVQQKDQQIFSGFAILGLQTS